MKKTLLLLPLLTFCVMAFSQNKIRFAGAYAATNKGGDAASFLNLIIMPNHFYAFVFFGGMEAGTWKSDGNTIIMQPDTSKNEDVYMFARHNEKLKNVSVQFDEFTDYPAIYSFDNENNNAVMHPVFNPYPNCIKYPYKIYFETGEHKSIQIVSFADCRNDGEYPQDSVTHAVYTFPLNAEYNDFKLFLNNEKAKSKEPMIAVWEDGILTIYLKFRKTSFKKTDEISEMRKEDLDFMKEFSNSINRPVKQHEFGELDEEENWIETIFPVIPFSKKEIKTVFFDTKNLFDAHCESSEDSTKIDSPEK